jgi:hypothetical protein
MARASDATLRELSGLLAQLRKIPDLTEAKPGIFYVKRLPMLHFHETDGGIFADLKCVLPAPCGFDRFELNNEVAKSKVVAETILRCKQLGKKAAP